MRGRRLIAAALGTTIVVAGTAVPGAFGAGAVTPPADTPNLALTVLQPSDLTPGVSIAEQNYIAPPKGFTAEYASVLTGAVTTGGTHYLQIEDYVALAPSTTVASGFYTQQQSFFTTPAGQKLLTKQLIKSFGKKSKLKRKDITYSTSVSAGVGTSSFVETITFKIKHRRIEEALAVFNDGDAYAGLVLVGGFGQQLPATDPPALAGTIDAHLHAVLGSTGATGTSGATAVAG